MGKKEDKEKQRREAGQAYRDEILALALKEVPEDQAKVIKEVLSSESVVDFLGNGVHRQSDYSRAMDQIRDREKELEIATTNSKKVYEDNIRWRAEQKPLVDKLSAENARMRKQLQTRADDDDDDSDVDGVRTPRGFDPEKYLSKDDVDKLVAERLTEVEQQGLSVMSVMTRLQGRHIKEFDDALDPDEVIKVARENQVPLEQAYDIHVSELREERRTKAHEEELEKVRKEEREKTLEEVRSRNSNLPFPVDNREPTIAEQLKADKSQYGSKAALDEYYASQRSAS